MTYTCTVDGAATMLGLEGDGARLAEQWIPWVDVDLAEEADRRLTWHLASGLDPQTRSLVISRLGEEFDRCAEEVRELRGAARRAALAQADRPPLATFVSRHGDAVGDVVVMPHAVSVEPRGLPSTYVPWGLVESVARDGHAFTFLLRGSDPVHVRGLGARSDEFEQTVGRARAAVDAAVNRSLAGLGVTVERLADGWAVSSAAASGALRDRWSLLARTEEVTALAELAEEMRYGLWTEGGAVTMPFVLARRGTRVAVEAADADDRATFVFEADNLDRLNAGLVLSAFRREVLSADAAELGRWTAAVRTQPAVRWLRGCVVARVVHSSGWSQAVRAALGA